MNIHKLLDYYNHYYVIRRHNWCGGLDILKNI